MDISKETGQRIRLFRKKRCLTIEGLADAISKSKATVGKYETGEITIDIVTLCDIAKVLGVHADQLLFVPPLPSEPVNATIPPFFKGMPQLFTYCFDGRDNRIMRGIIDILEQTDANAFKVMLYLNYDSYNNYKNCENTYIGSVHHYEVFTHFRLVNQDSHTEQTLISVMNAYADSNTKWCLFSSVSSRPLMPIAIKHLISKRPLSETDELVKKLKISKEDIRLLKHYNGLVVV